MQNDTGTTYPIYVIKDGDTGYAMAEMVPEKGPSAVAIEKNGRTHN